MSVPAMASRMRWLYASVSSTSVEPTSKRASGWSACGHLLRKIIIHYHISEVCDLQEKQKRSHILVDSHTGGIIIDCIQDKFSGGEEDAFNILWNYA